MEREKVVVKTSFTGISMQFIKRLLLLLLIITLSLVFNNLRNNLYREYNITSSILAASDIGLLKILAVYVALLIFVIIVITLVIRLLLLIYEMKRVVTFDFKGEKILLKEVHFPFTTEVNEKNFNQIIEVNIIQNISDKFVDSGNVTIEYLVYSKNDSKIKYFELPHIMNPMEIKEKLISD